MLSYYKMSQFLGPPEHHYSYIFKLYFSNLKTLETFTCARAKIILTASTLRDVTCHDLKYQHYITARAKNRTHSKYRLEANKRNLHN